jgi:hypothetical protein
LCPSQAQQAAIPTEEESAKCFFVDTQLDFTWTPLELAALPPTL